MHCSEPGWKLPSRYVLELCTKFTIIANNNRDAHACAVCSRTAKHLPNGHIAFPRFPRKVSHITRTSYPVKRTKKCANNYAMLQHCEPLYFYLAAPKSRLYHNNLPAECVGVLLYIGSRSQYRTQAIAR